MTKIKENNIYFYFNKNKLIENLNKYSRIGKVYYPLKTNSNKNLLKELKKSIDRNDNGFLISSITDFETLKKLGINPLQICFINVLAESDTVKFLYESGVRFFTFDNINSLIEFSKYANLSETKIAIRISTMQVFTNKFTHLGSDISELIKMLDFLKGKCNNYGISFYIQNNLKTEEDVLEKILQYIQEKFINSGIRFMNIGGIPQIENIDKNNIENLKNKLKIDELILEIGRYLVEDTIELKTRVIREKIINNNKIIIIKNGIYSGFFDILLYNKKFSIYFLSKSDGEVKVEYERTGESNYEFIMCGGSSDSGDKLGKMYINSKYKDELIRGAEFCIKDVGAYFEEFFMPYSNDLNKVYIIKK